MSSRIPKMDWIPKKTWKRQGSDYSSLIPWWLRLGLLLAALVGLASDVTSTPWTPANLWIIIQFILSYAAIGLCLISIQASLILCAVAMGTTFATHLPFFPMIAATVIMLVVCTLSRHHVMVIHWGLSLAWLILTTWLVELRGVGSTIAFWWGSISVLCGASLIGLALRYLVVRTVKMRRQLVAVRARQEEVRREERQHLARELHDVVAHHITVITMNVMAHRKSRDPDLLQDVLGIIDDSAREALSELRALLDVLRTAETKGPKNFAEQINTIPLISEQVNRHMESLKRLGFTVTSADTDPRVESLPFSLRNTCARLIQESVTNIAKHAQKGAACSITLAVKRTEVQVRITNSHPKITTRQRPGGYGLTSLHERVIAVKGSYSSELRGDQWVVEAHIPIHSSDPSHPTPHSPPR
mgnify:CR=1 FL=1